MLPMMPPVRRGAERDSWRLFASLALGLLLAAAATGQMTTNQILQERTVTGALAQVETYPYRLGPIRFSPVLRLYNAGYDSNVFGLPAPFEVARYTASVAGGFRWLIPAGSKFYVVGAALPAYIWYEDLSARSFFGGNYSAYLLGIFNRATLKVGGFNSKQLQYISSQTTAPVIQTTLDGSISMNVELASNFSLYANAEYARLRFGNSDLSSDFPGGLVDTNQLQRSEGSAGAGIQYRFSPALNVGLGYEKTLTEFVFFPGLNDNQSDAYLINIRYDRPRFYLTLSGGYRQGKPYNGSSFSNYSTPTGGYFASYFLTPSLELQAYGDRRETYGLLVPAFLATRYGGSIYFRVYKTLRLRALGVWGTNKYGSTTADGTVTPGYTDRTLDYGGGFSTTIFRKTVWSITATESQLQSGLPGLDRKALRVLTSFTLDQLFYR
jgi:hypothetical protein